MDFNLIEMKLILTFFKQITIESNKHYKYLIFILFVYSNYLLKFFCNLFVTFLKK